jgi:hypothetical protein
VVEAALGGWRLSGINTMTSGLPVNINYAPPTAFSVSSAPTYRPIYVGGSYYSEERSPTNYFNKAAFLAPSTLNPNDPSSPFGSLGRNVAVSPSIFTLDLGVHKSFRLPREGMGLDFRTEFFNILNHTNFGAPNNNILAGNFGTITGLSTTPRQIQFALKLLF